MSTSHIPFPTLHPLVRRVVDAFGPQRCFWGTDLSHLPCPYKQVVTLFTEEMKSLSTSELECDHGPRYRRMARLAAVRNKPED